MANTDLSEISKIYPLARYEGEPPKAPEWFRKFVQTKYSAHSVNVDGAKVSYQQWGHPNNPGLLLVHGGGAHAHWYDFIAPAFMEDFNVVAMTFSGMGDSEWRDAYSLEQFSAEQIAVMKDASFFEHPVKPIIAAHSFGGVITLNTASRSPDRLGGVAIMDTPIYPPKEAQGKPTPKPRTANIYFPDERAALSRFRLLPAQPCENHYILDHIARHSLKKVERNGATGWAWKFDPTLWEKIDGLHKGQWDLLPNISCRLAFMRGEKSALVTRAVRQAMLGQVQVPFASVENAHHHLFLDNPLGTIAALGEIISDWTKTSK